MYKLITLIVILSITSMPVAIAAEVPFYLKDRSRLPNRTVDPKNNLYIPSRSQYADWLVKRAAEVSSKLDDCYKELDGHKAASEKEKLEMSWVLVKISKKKNYLKFLNEKFKKVTGSSLADAGYDFSSQETKEKLSIVRKEASAEINEPLKEELAPKKEGSTLIVLDAAIAPNPMPTKTPAVAEPMTTELAKQEPVKTEEKSFTAIYSVPTTTPSKELTTQTKNNEPTGSADQIPTQNPDTNIPNLPISMDLKETEEKEKDDGKKPLAEDSKVVLVQEIVKSRKESDHVVTEKDLAMANDEQEKKEDTTSESLLVAPLSIVEENRKEVIQKIDSKKSVASTKETTVVSQVSEKTEGKSDLTNEIPLTAPVVDHPIIEQKTETVTKQESSKVEPLIMETKTVETATEQKKETPEVYSLKEDTLVIIKDKKVIPPDAVPTISVETEHSVEETKTVTTMAVEKSPQTVPVDPKQENSKKEEIMMDNLISQKKKELNFVEITKENSKLINPAATPAQVKPEIHEDLAPVVAAPAHDRIMEEGEIQEDNGPSY